MLRHAPPDCLLAAAGCLIPIAIWQPKLISIHGGVPLLVRMLNAPLQPLSRLSAVQILAQLVVDETDCGRLVDGGGLHPLLALALDGRGQRKNKAGSAAWERHTRDAARESTAGSGRPDQTFEILSRGHIEVDSADFWTDRVLSSSSRSKAEVASKLSRTLTLKSS